jgi:PKD repeat protein
MYTANPSDNNGRGGYYGVSSIPELKGLGNKWAGSPSALDTATVRKLGASGSPLGITVKETTNGNTRSVKVKLYSFGTFANANYVLRVAVVQNPVQYLSSPGSNGEKDFKGVMRKMLPSHSGTPIQLPSPGDSAEYNFSYTLASGWVASNVYSIAFVQRENTKEIINSGSVKDPPLKVSTPVADFSIPSAYVCPGKTIQFNDQSKNNPNSWTWYFPGGTPATSTAKNPFVSYSVPGTYDVALRVKGYTGADSIYKTGVVQVGVTGKSVPFTEGFESTTFPPANWTLYNPDNGITWKRTTAAKKSGVASAFMNNANYAVNGAVDELILPPLDLSSMNYPALMFDYAYTYYTQPYQYTDTLEIMVSDCGGPFQSIYKNYGNNFITASPTTNSFVPTASQWATETLDLSSFMGSPNCIIKFRHVCDYENNMYVDNVNVNYTTGLNEKAMNSMIRIVPNPSSGSIQLRGIDPMMKAIVNLYHVTGSKVFAAESSGGGAMDVSSVSPGVYTAEIITPTKRMVQKLVISR